MKSESWKRIFFFNFQFWVKIEIRKNVLFHFNFKLKIEWHFRCTKFLFKTNFKKQKSEFLNSFFDLMLKNEFQNILLFLRFGYEIKKMKNEKFSKFVVFKSKSELYFRYMDYYVSFTSQCTESIILIFHFIQKISN